MVLSILKNENERDKRKGFEKFGRVKSVVLLLAFIIYMSSSSSFLKPHMYVCALINSVVRTASKEEKTAYSISSPFAMISLALCFMPFVVSGVGFAGEERMPSITFARRVRAAGEISKNGI